MTLTFDQATYADLLMEMTPKVIETEAEYEKVLVEAEYYSMKEVSPTEVLTHILEASYFTAADLVGLLGSSDVVSEVLEGKQAITKVQAQILGDRFKVSPSLFID